MGVALYTCEDFYPRPPRGGRPMPLASVYFRYSNFYPRPPRGGRPFAALTISIIGSISIHALREEGDESLKSSIARIFYFYPRPPRGGRPRRSRSHRQCRQFLSTPSARRATTTPHRVFCADRHFYPRPPRGGRRLSCRQGRPQVRISIHALREEGD